MPYLVVVVVVVVVVVFFFFFILGRMGENKALAHHTLPRIFIRVVCRFDSVAFAPQR